MVRLERALDEARDLEEERAAILEDKVYLTERVYKVVLQKSIPAQICQLILYISNNDR